jgi:glycosyltransferase involved in cell wall biosynthesis
VPLGHYRGTYPDTVSRDEARRRLGLDGDRPVLLYLGGIRPYKNVPELVRRFRESTLSGVLLVVGRPDSDAVGAGVREAAEGDPRVRLRLDFVDAAELQLYFRAADLAVFPYREVANSSSALLSLSFDCPILVPAKGAMGDLRDGVGEGWVRTYTGPLTPRELEDALGWARRHAGGGHAPLDGFAWEALAERTVRLYAEVVGAGEGRE